jgi:hypothetical protein
MKKYIPILAIGLICHKLVGEVVAQNFQSVDDLVANVKRDDPTRVLYDTNGIIVGVQLAGACCTDHNLQLLSKVKSIRYLFISGISVSTSGILSLVEYPNLTGLGIACGSGPGKSLASALPSLTNLQSLELVQTAYWTNDAIYLAKMTNLVALQMAGSIPHTQAELLPLTNLVNLRRLLIFSSDEGIKNVDASIFSRFDKLTAFVISSDIDLAEEEAVWKRPVVK